MNNRPLLGTPFWPCSSVGSGGSCPVVSVPEKKSAVCVSIFLSLCVVKRRYDRLRMACFQCINHCHSFRHVCWLGSLFFERILTHKLKICIKTGNVMKYQDQTISTAAYIGKRKHNKLHKKSHADYCSQIQKCVWTAGENSETQANNIQAEFECC